MVLACTQAVMLEKKCKSLSLTLIFVRITVNYSKLLLNINS